MANYFLPPLDTSRTLTRSHSARLLVYMAHAMLTKDWFWLMLLTLPVIIAYVVLVFGDIGIAFSVFAWTIFTYCMKDAVRELSEEVFDEKFDEAQEKDAALYSKIKDEYDIDTIKLFTHDTPKNQ